MNGKIKRGLTMEYLAIKRNKVLLIHVRTWTNLKDMWLVKEARHKRAYIV